MIEIQDLIKGDDVVLGWLASWQHAIISQGWICSDNDMPCYTEREVADQTFYFTQSEYTDRQRTLALRLVIEIQDLINGDDVVLGWLASWQHASISQGWICSDNDTCCHTERAVADQMFYIIIFLLMLVSLLGCLPF